MDDLNETGCLFLDKCLMPGLHMKSECHTVKMLIDEFPDDDICGICGEPGADKMALWTGGGIYWPGEFRPETELVHAECERAETARAHAALTQEQRNAVLHSI